MITRWFFAWLKRRYERAFRIDWDIYEESE